MMNDMYSDRSDWIDIAKGIGIITVIIVHSIIPLVNIVTTHLSAFAIQLFFVVTGLTYNNERYRSQISHLAAVRGRQLLIPYLLLYILMVGIFIPLSPLIETSLTPDQLLFWFIYGSGPPQSSTHLWFLPVLFFGLVLFAVLDKMASHLRHGIRYVFLFVLPILASCLSLVFDFELVPWHVNAILIATAFIFFGNEIRLYNGGVNIKISKIHSVFLFFISFIILLVVSTLNGFTDLAVDNTGANIWLYMLAGMTGSIMCLSLANLLSRAKGLISRLLVSFGKNSQVVYEFHPLLFFLVAPILFLLGIFSEHLFIVNDWIWTLRLFLALSLSLPIVIYVIERYAILRFIFRGTTKARS